MRKAKNFMYWVLAPFLGDDNYPSIKRFLIMFFALEIDRVISTRPWDVYTVSIISVFIIMIGILLGLTTYQTLIKFFKITRYEEERQKEVV